MNEMLQGIQQYLTIEKILALSRAVFLILAGWLAAKVASRGVVRLASERIEKQGQLLLRRATYGVVLALFLVAALHQLGFNLGVLLGAAGVLSVAIGFASQTSASNIISGLFLIAERPFGVGDVIQTGSTTGEVLAVDLLSVKLRTFDNLFVRIPNESLIKSEVRSLTRFPLRRVDVALGVAYKEDLDRVREVLFALADANPLSLDEPRPQLQLQGFGDSAVNVQFSVWATKENFLELKNRIQIEIKRAFDERGIEIPFPHRSLYAGSVTEPLPVRLVSEGRLEKSPA